MVVLIVAVAVLGFQWIQVRKTQIKSETIVKCADVAARAGNDENPFNGGVYQFCIDDNGYETVLK